MTPKEYFMTAKEYLTERQRMIDYNDIHDWAGFILKEKDQPDQAITIVSEWSKAHPRISWVEEIFGMYID